MNTNPTAQAVPTTARPKSRTEMRRLTMSAMMGAVAFALMYINVGIPVISPYAEFDLSALPELLAGFILGPLGAVLTITVKIALILVFKGTSSMYTGEVQNFILSLAYVLPAVYFYRRHRTKKGAILGLVLGSVISIIVAIFTNIYLIFPAYIALYGMNWEGIIETCGSLNPWIHDIPTFAAFSVVPFNIISRGVTSLLAFVTYKKLSVPMKKLIQD